MEQSPIAGIDIRSWSIESAVVEKEMIADQAKVLTTFDPLNLFVKILKRVRAELIAAIGYGRKLLVGSLRLHSFQTVTEIQAYALGDHFLYPAARTVLDIGGQDTKLGRVGKKGSLVFAGGAAYNPCVRALLNEELPPSLYVPANPDMIGAIGAALYGKDLWHDPFYPSGKTI